MWYAVTALLIIVGVVATWTWRPADHRWPELATGTPPPMASVTVQGERDVAAPQHEAVGPGSASAVSDTAAVKRATAIGRGTGEPSAGAGSQPRSGLRIGLSGGGGKAVPLAAAGESDRAAAALFFVPNDQLDREWDMEIDKPALYGKHVLRGRVKFWSEDGGRGEPILTENVGSKPLAEVMRDRAIIAMMRRTGFERRYHAALAAGRSGTDPPRAAPPTNRRGITFLPSVVTMATPAADLVGGKPLQGNPADKELPPLPRGVRYASSATFEISDVTPGSVELWCWYYTHNRLAGIRLNGKLLSVPKQPDDSFAARLFEFSSSQGFVQGTNTLEIDVDDPSAQASAVGGPPRFGMVLGGFWMAASSELSRPKPPGAPRAAASGNSRDSGHPQRTSR